MLPRESSTINIVSHNLPQSPLLARARREEAAQRESVRGETSVQVLNTVSGCIPHADARIATSVEPKPYYRAGGERMRDPEAERAYAESLMENLPPHLAHLKNRFPR